jgi:hypothetical protein
MSGIIHTVFETAVVLFLMFVIALAVTGCAAPCFSVVGYCTH